MGFSKDFVWGAATSAYQIEGAADADGKGESVWDVMCKKEGAVWQGGSGETACNHYRRYKEDVALMKEIGLKGYRLSISWPRVLAEGTGRVNEKGLEFYDRLIDELLANGIIPYVTLFHWDYPYQLYQRGGWLNDESPQWFAEYAKIVVERLSDRVAHWMTVNEPQCFVHVGHTLDTHAPGDKLELKDILQISHNVLLAHGRAVQAIRSAAKGECFVSFAPMGIVSFPETNKKKDVDAARENMFSINGKHTMQNTWWLDPVLAGEYPADGVELFGKDMPQIGAEDMEIISEPIDFLGINIYHGIEVRADGDGKAVVFLTSFHWPITPETLYWGPKFLYERYNKPIVITENGMSNNDWVAMDGGVHDPQRIDFLSRYLQQLNAAVSDGVQVQGYFVWSFMDNFEWAEGYKQRFGIVHVDFDTQKRTMKDSALWYKKVIESNGKSIF